MFVCGLVLGACDDERLEPVVEPGDGAAQLDAVEDDLAPDSDASAPSTSPFPRCIPTLPPPTSCTLADLETDPWHCGACDAPCLDGACRGGECTVRRRGEFELTYTGDFGPSSREISYDTDWLASRLTKSDGPDSWQLHRRDLADGQIDGFDVGPVFELAASRRSAVVAIATDVRIAADDTDDEIDVYVFDDDCERGPRRVATPDARFVPSGHPAFDLSADGRWLAMAVVTTNGGHTVFVHDLETGAVKRLGGRGDRVAGFDLSDDGKVIAHHLISDAEGWASELRVVDLETMAMLGQWDDAPVWSLGPEGRWFAEIEWEPGSAFVRLRDLQTGASTEIDASSLRESVDWEPVQRVTVIDGDTVALGVFDPDSIPGHPSAHQWWLWRRTTGTFTRLDAPTGSSAIGNAELRGPYADSRQVLVETATPLLGETGGWFWVPVGP